MKKIEKVVVKKMMDEMADTSTLGEYTDNIEEGVIIRHYDEFYEKLSEEDEIPSKGREFRAFKPYAGGEKVGTKEYYEYGMQDYKRMEGLSRGDWYYIGIGAEATILTSQNGKEWKIDKITSAGLWGIESDSGEDYFESVRKAELNDLSSTLKEFGFTQRQINAAIKNAEWEDK